MRKELKKNSATLHAPPAPHLTVLGNSSAVKSEGEQRIVLKFSTYQNGVCSASYALDSNSILIGRGANCDIVLDNPHIAYYHALATTREGLVTLTDLGSQSGLYINGKKINYAIISSGDLISFGELEFHIEETLSSFTMRDRESKATVFNPILIKTSTIESAPIEGLTLIDGEYCDIQFPEAEGESASPATPVLASALENLDFKDYIDTAESEAKSEAVKMDHVEERSLELSVYVGENLLSVDYFQIRQNRPIPFLLPFPQASIEGEQSEKNGRSDKHKLLPLLSLKKQKLQIAPIAQTGLRDIQIFKMKNEEKVFRPLMMNDGPIEIAEDESVLLMHKTIKLYCCQKVTPPRLRPVAFLMKDKFFAQQMGKTLGVGLALFIMLLLIDTKIAPEPPKPKIAVIYKLPKETLTHQSEEKSDGAAAAASAPAESAPAPIPEPKRATKPIAEVKPKDVKVKPNPAPVAKVQEVVKAPEPVFKLKMNNSLSKVLDKPNFAAPKGAAAAPSASAATGAEGDFSLKNVDTSGAKGGLGAGGAGTSNAIGKMGTGNGSGGKGFGSHGIGEKGKTGNADMYSEKTVQLGSIDPDLLRKILREHIPQFKHCYQRELQASRDLLKGVLDLRFQIDANGRATKVAIGAGNSQFSAQGINCIENVLKLIDFPQPKGGGVVDVRQPLNFFSEKDTLN